MHWKEYKLEGWQNFAIKNKIEYPELDILLLNIGYPDNLRKEGWKNLLAINKNGEIKWIANLPSAEQDLYSAYSIIEPENDKKFKAWSGSTSCAHDVAHGPLFMAKFVK